MLQGTELGHGWLEGARLALVRHAPGLAVPPHDHGHACVHVVLRGLYVERSAQGLAVACPGDVVRKEPGCVHWNRFARTGAESLRLSLAEGAADELSGAAERVRWALSVERALQRERALPPRTAPAAGVPAAPQVRLLERLRRRFREPLVLADLARELGVHRSHLTRQFARDFGCSPRTYVLHRRVAWVAEHLARDTGRLCDLAVAAGFYDHSHCTRAFRSVLGRTPIALERELRG